MTRPELRLHSDRLLANIRAVRTRIEPSSLMIVLKDDAYGHGLEWVVDAARTAGVDWFGSYDVRSALQVRRLLGDSGRIFAWATSTDSEIDEALLQGIDLGVGTREYLDRVIARAAALGLRARVHLKIDTGLHRNGLRPEEWPDTIAAARHADAEGQLELVGVWSHLAEASDDEDDDARDVFLDAIDQARAAGAAPDALHLTASAASWWRPELRGTVSRIGAFCYGIRSADGPDLEGIVPVAELVASVVGVDGDRVEIEIGAFDGVPSTLAGAFVGTPGGVRELVTVGATSSTVAAWPGASVGDEVTLFGPGDDGEPSATTLAERIDTVGEEILTRLTSHVRRIIVD